MITLNKILKKKGMSQTTLATKLGVSRQRVNRWVQGINYPNKKNIKEISAILDVSVEELFFNEK
ncbi:XRE family transcriptional regulator [Candidatus Atribacteria bacterium 1244-E10-H5-B2]|nr:MAG: XRE family transcriptional regulator [Candidatus Atribacteria bacterium 1244-E10-H5-B2]